jgi:hypothetical protein
MIEWPKDRARAMVQLAMMFPSLREAPGANPWQPRILIRWCMSFYPEGEYPQPAWAARFLLAVWDPKFDWTESAAYNLAFNLMEAWAEWDSPHRAAALRWLENPF